jgi:hypothetical protein
MNPRYNTPHYRRLAREQDDLHHLAQVADPYAPRATNYRVNPRFRRRCIKLCTPLHRHPHITDQALP